MRVREGQSRREDVPRRVVARRPRRRCRRARDELLRRHGDDAARVPGRLGRQPGHPAHSGLAGALPDRTGRQDGQAAAAARDLRGPRPGVRLGRPARAAGVVGPDDRLRRTGHDRRPGGVPAARSQQRRPRPGGRRLRDVAGRAVASHRAPAPSGRGRRARAGAPRGGRPRASAPGRPHPAQLPDPGRDHRGRCRRARCRRARGRPRPTPRGGVATAAPADRRHRAAGAEDGPDRARGGHALADGELELLSHRHSDRRSRHRADEVVAPDPREGGQGDHAHLHRPGRPAS